MPVTMSALIIGMLVTPMITARLLRFCPISAMQVTVPMMVDTTVEISAMISVFASALRIEESLNRFRYQPNVKPPQRALDLLELNESTMSVTIGAYMKMTMRAM